VYVCVEVVSVYGASVLWRQQRWTRAVNAPPSLSANFSTKSKRSRSTSKPKSREQYSTCRHKLLLIAVNRAKSLRYT